jgi:hypothetical protein
LQRPVSSRPFFIAPQTVVRVFLKTPVPLGDFSSDFAGGVVMFARSFRISFPAVATLLVLIAFLQINANAQSTRTIDGASRRMDDFRKQREKAERDQKTGDIDGRKVSPEALKRAAAIKQELKEDLESLQVEYNGLVTKLKLGEPFSAAETIEIGERVHSRSSRLEKNLNLPSPADDAQGEKPIEDRPAATLKNLCLKIFSFITHPMLDTPGTIDIRSSAEMKALLDEIIWMSDELRHTK